MTESTIKDDVLELRRTTQDLIRVVASTGQKVIKVTSENIKEFDKLLKEIPEKYKSKEEQ